MSNRNSLNLLEAHYGGDCDSAFECDSEYERKKRKRKDLAVKDVSKFPKKVSKQVFQEECSKEEGRKQRFHFLALDAYSRHKKLINEYILLYPGCTSKLKRDTSRDKTDLDVIQSHHRFLWSNDEAVTWEQKLAKAYYDKLFKEYCISDLRFYKENKVALRWRTEKEVIDGKGQFICGDKYCSNAEDLTSWEVNFGYYEQGEKKNALVKLRLCPECSNKLNYHHKRKEIKQPKKIKPGETSGLESTEQEHSEEKSSNPEEGNQAIESAKDIEESSIWKQSANKDEEKSLTDEFEEYLSGMFL